MLGFVWLKCQTEFMRKRFSLEYIKYIRKIWLVRIIITMANEIGLFFLTVDIDKTTSVHIVRKLEFEKSYEKC